MEGVGKASEVTNARYRCDCFFLMSCVDCRILTLSPLPPTLLSFTELVEMQHTCKLGIREDVASRSSLIGGISSSALGGGEDGSALSRASKSLFSAFGALVKGEGNF